MAEIRSLNDELVKRTVAHVFAKYCADVPNAKGVMVASKTKYKLTASALRSQYKLIVEPKFLKSKAVRYCTAASRRTRMQPY